MKVIVTSERLVIRELMEFDNLFILELLNTEGWLKFIGDRNIKTVKDAKNYILNGPIASYQKNGFGLWLVLEKATNIPIGLCGLLKRDYLESPDIGYAFLPNFSKKGLAFESAVAVKNYAINQFKINQLYATTKLDNMALIKLLEKLEFKFIENRKINEEEVSVFEFLKTN
jgi:RimJ/RimL family protein N-acetyltransferase